jgi:hypothetical protein
MFLTFAEAPRGKVKKHNSKKAVMLRCRLRDHVVQNIVMGWSMR